GADRTFGADDNAAIVLGRDGEGIPIGRRSKKALADAVLHLAGESLRAVHRIRENPALHYKAGDSPRLTNAQRRKAGTATSYARRIFTCGSVTEGHPDKIADQISDGILDALIGADPRSRVAVETLITTGQVHVAGEVTTSAYADIPAIIRETILRIGYDSSKK